MRNIKLRNIQVFLDLHACVNKPLLTWKQLKTHAQPGTVVILMRTFEKIMNNIQPTKIKAYFNPTNVIPTLLYDMVLYIFFFSASRI